MLNVGPPELILIFVIALVIVGPERLPELGRMIGKGMRELRKMQDEVRDLVNTGMGDDFKQTTAELKKTAAELKSATDVRSAFRDDPPRPRPKASARASIRASDEQDDRPPPDDADPAPAPVSTETPPPGDPVEEPRS
ncbi:MAG TPA: twin-arginine translocase TatA/TatE family subunit [Actinomycetota bacterium]